jgi:hypothetical protein
MHMKRLSPILLSLLLLCACPLAQAITKVQTCTGNTSAATATTISITCSGVAAGDTLIVTVGYTLSGSSGSTITVSDGQGSYTADASLSRGSPPQNFSGIFSLFNTNSGTHTITASASAGTSGNTYWAINAVEVSGIGTVDSVDQTGTNSANTSTTPTVVTAGALAQGSEFVVMSLVTNQHYSGGTFPPTGGNNSPYISIYSVNNLICSFDSDYQINTTATTAPAAAWGTLTTSQIWSAVAATYKASGVVSAKGNFFLVDNRQSAVSLP